MSIKIIKRLKNIISVPNVNIGNLNISKLSWRVSSTVCLRANKINDAIPNINGIQTSTDVNGLSAYMLKLQKQYRQNQS